VNAGRGSSPFRKYAVALARVLAVAALLAVALAYGYAVWRVAAYAWLRGLRFYQSNVINADAVRDVIHCFVLGVGALVLPRFAGVGLPRVKGAGRLVYGYLGLAALAAAAVAVNHVRPFYSSPFAGNGPLFFTLGPLAWELLWPGFVYGFATAFAGPRAPAAVKHALVVVLALAGTAWYAPLLRGLNALEAATFIGLALAVSFLSLALRRRTGSIWSGCVGHVLVYFFLTW
jgi:hypothetical protein